MSIDSPAVPGLCTLDSDCPTGFICDGGICVPEGGGGGTLALPGLGNYLRPRYTSNLAVTEQMSALDLLTEVIFPASRSFLAQDENGRLMLKNKKPANYGRFTATASIGADYVYLDDISPWISLTSDTYLCISPHTNKSEIGFIRSANYTTDQNSVGLSSTGGLFTISGFSGCNGASTPATASITVSGLGTPPVACSITLNGVTFAFTTTTADTTESIASYIAGVISSHPALWRKFDVSWSSGSSVVNLTARFGRVRLWFGLIDSHSGPLADPTTAPTLTAASGALAAGEYAVAVCAVNSNGETLLSKYKTITLTANQKIDVSSYTLPGGATSLKWFCSPEANSNKLRFVAENTGSAFSITSLPKLSAALPPDLNRTGSEVIEVKAVFTDRGVTRTRLSAANILKATYNWLLGNRGKSINRIDLKYRDATQDYRLIELRVRDDTHIAKVKKVLKEEVNGQAIDNTDQAYRIAAGLLAEKLDADFFYEWKATRAALLLQEGDVVAITDEGSGVVNMPVIIEQIRFEADHAGMPIASFTARKYASSLYDDSIVDRVIPVVSEN